MNIAMLTSDYLPSIGGIASHIYELSKELEKLGHTVEIWYWNRKQETLSINDCGDLTTRIINVPPLGSLKTAKQLSQAINIFSADFKPDIIHIHTLDPLLLSTYFFNKTYRCKLVWTNHSSRFIRKTNESLLWRLKMKLYVAKIDGLLTASNDRLSASQFLPIKHQLNVANGVQVEKFSGTSQSDARKQLSIDDRIFTLLYTGRFAPIKGVTDLAHALVELNQRDPAFLCLMCGNIEGDRESEKVKKILTDGGIIDKVRFEGFIPNAELSTHLAACDVLVLPSHMEATSISGLEAMAAS